MVLFWTDSGLGTDFPMGKGRQGSSPRQSKARHVPPYPPAPPARGQGCASGLPKETGKVYTDLEGLRRSGHGECGQSREQPTEKGTLLVNPSP